MRNKVLSVLLAVAMLAALVVPAFALTHSSVEATRTEVASLALGDWVTATDGVVTVKVGDTVSLGNYLAAYNEGKTAVRVAPECTYALVANTDKVTLTADGVLVGAKQTAEGEVVEVLATSVDNKELTLVLKVAVSFTAETTTAEVPTVVNATGFTAEGMDLTVKLSNDDDGNVVVNPAETTVKLKAVSAFAADKVVFTEAQKNYLENAALTEMTVTGWVNVKVNNQLVKLPLWLVVYNKDVLEDVYLDLLAKDPTKLNTQIEVPLCDLLAKGVVKLQKDKNYEVGASETKLPLVFEPTLLDEIGESATFSVVAKDFPVVKADGTEGVAKMPALNGSVKVAAKSTTTEAVEKSSLGIVPSAVTVEVGKFVDVVAVYNKLGKGADVLTWGVSYAENASLATDYAVVWGAEDVIKQNDDDKVKETCHLMGVRVGSNVVTVSATAGNTVLTSKALVTVVPRVDAVVDDAESDVPQTGAALLANLF